MLPATTASAHKRGNPVLVELTRGERIETRPPRRGGGHGGRRRGDRGLRRHRQPGVRPLRGQAAAGAEPRRERRGGRVRPGPGRTGAGLRLPWRRAFSRQAVAAWLGKLGLDERTLVCGPHPPLDADAAAELIRASRPATPIHNNCSGKHAGFLTVARHLGLPLGGYGDPDHPLQVRIRRDIEAMGDLRVSRDMLGVDGCGVPAFALPLRALALAFARFAGPARLGPRRAEAVQRLARAMAAHPGMIAGRGRFDTMVISASLGRILSKGGAEGVHAAALADTGIGIAVKIDDGGKRAAEAAMATALLARHPAGAAASVLAGYARQPLRNTLGTVIGEMRPAAGWLAG